MEKKYLIDGCDIKVTLSDRSIHIINDRMLWQLLGAKGANQATLLVKFIKEDFRLEQGTDLKISENSLVVEIWGHVYFEYYALILKKRIQFKFMQRFLLRLLNASDTIDCGVAGVDRNRWFWDFLAHGKKWIAVCLPKEIHKKGLK